jgi:predicted acetyltransferase
MTLAGEVTLDAATPDDAALIANLMELYIHDLSAVFTDVALGPDGRFGYSKLPLYWSEPERRFPFLIRCDARIAGFVLVTRGSPASDDPDTLDIAEFFVLRRYRRSRVGHRAARLLWNHLPGRWTVRVTEANTVAVAFWHEVIDAAVGSRATCRTIDGRPAPWRTYTFESATGLTR